MSRPRVDLVAPPMSGHLHPILGIARRLARDLDVRVISTAAAQPEIRAAGLEGVALMAGADAAISAMVNPSHRVGSAPWRLHAQFRQNLQVLRRCQGELRALWDAGVPALVIADFTIPVAGSVARERGIHWWTAAPSPCAIETPDGPPAYLGGWRRRSGPLARMRDAAGRAVISAFKRGVHSAHRQVITDLGFPSVYRADGSEAIYSDERVLALGLEALEFPRRWPASVQFVGPVLYTPDVDVPPPPFRDGRRHVLVTVGTHMPWWRDRVMAAVRVAARGVPAVEFHVSDGDRCSVRAEAAGNVRRLGYVNYARDLKRYDLVVHHAGTGAMYHTLANGIPAIALPADFDQFDNAARLEACGAGMWIRREGDLAVAVAMGLDDLSMRERCARLAAAIVENTAEDRVAALVATTLHRS